jgi:hypothetical protein
VTDINTCVLPLLISVTLYEYQSKWNRVTDGTRPAHRSLRIHAMLLQPDEQRRVGRGRTCGNRLMLLVRPDAFSQCVSANHQAVDFDTAKHEKHGVGMSPN